MGTSGKARSALLFTLLLGAVLAALVATVGTMRQAEAAASPEKIVFASERTMGKGVSNPTGDAEIFRMNPNGTGVRQLTFNQADDFGPNLSPDGQKIAYESIGSQPSNPEGDREVYVMNADGSGITNLTNNRATLNDRTPEFSPDGQKIAFVSEGEQVGNPQADSEIYAMNLDGSDQKNLTNNGDLLHEVGFSFSPDGQKIAYTSFGPQASNPEGEPEVYVMSASDGSGQKNLTNNDGVVADQDPSFSPEGQKIAYTSDGPQTSNPVGGDEVYVMNSDGSGQKNLTNNGWDTSDRAPTFSPDGQRVLYKSQGGQASNPEGDDEVYAMSALDGTSKKNLSNTGAGVDEFFSDLSPDGQKIVYTSDGVQTSNPQGDREIYVMNAPDGSGKKNLTNNNARDYEPEWGR